MDALSACAILFTVYFLAMLAYSICKKNDLDLPRIIYINIIILYALLLITASVMPIISDQIKDVNSIPFYKLTQISGAQLGYYIGSIAINAAIYLPLGFFVAMQCKLKADSSPFLRTILTAAIVAISLEFMQLILPVNRICNVDEMIFDVVGAILGCALFRPVSFLKPMRSWMKDILYR